VKISTEINTTAKITGEEKAIELVAKAGFDAWDFSMFGICDRDWENLTASPNSHPVSGPNYLAHARKLKQIGLDNGIICNQSHAPFPMRLEGIMTFVKRAIECTAEAGGEICVIHPDNRKSAEENSEMFLSLLEFSKDMGIKIATENMWNWDSEKDEAYPAACSGPEDFCKHIDLVANPRFCACLDLGHAEMRGLNTTAVEMIKALGPRLKALHIHDNDKWHDSHQIPFSMDMDFEAIVKALKEINYDGYFTLEADRYLANHTIDNVFDGVRDMAKATRQLADMYESM